MLLKMNKLIENLTLVVVAIILSAASSMADTYTFSGTTEGGPTFIYPDNGAISPPYSLLQFSVGTSGNYTIITQTTTLGIEPLLLLFQNSFNPANEIEFTENLLLIGGGDGPIATVGVDNPLVLSSEINYYLIHYMLSQNPSQPEFSSFTTTVEGPGSITPNQVLQTPEPTSVALLGIGLTAGAALIRKRRQRQNLHLR